MNTQKTISIVSILLILVVLASLIKFSGLYLLNIDITIEQPPVSDIGNAQPTPSYLEVLTKYKWVWTKTYNGTGPEADNINPIVPKVDGRFTIIFKEDGSLSGTTDCNGFGGNYTIESGIIKFGPMMSTLMYCEGSQEQEFRAMLTDSIVTVGEDGIMLENDKSVFFGKATLTGEEI